MPWFYVEFIACNAPWFLCSSLIAGFPTWWKRDAVDKNYVRWEVKESVNIVNIYHTLILNMCAFVVSVCVLIKLYHSRKPSACKSSSMPVIDNLSHCTELSCAIFCISIPVIRSVVPTLIVCLLVFLLLITVCDYYIVDKNKLSCFV